MAKQTAERLIARKDLIEALEQGRTRLGLRLRSRMRSAMRWRPMPRRRARRRAVLGAGRLAAREPGYGLPAQIDPLEGWIVSAGTPAPR